MTAKYKTQQYKIILLAALALVAVVNRPAPAADKKNTTNKITRKSRVPLPQFKGVTHKNLKYARLNRKPLLLDLYLPDKPTPHPLPVIVWVHGGGWLAGSKDRTPAKYMVNDGYAVASINYRLSTEAAFPAQIHDCKAAVRWLRANAKKYNLDPKHIGAWGGSAGGHLVALLGTSGDVKELEGKMGNLKYSSRIQAVSDWFGPTDLLQMDKYAPANRKIIHNNPNSPESLLIGGPIQQNREKVAMANPITYVTKDDPPFFIVHGDKDPIVPHHQSEILHQALKKAGVQTTLHTVKGAGHGFKNRNVYPIVKEFFDKHLKKNNPNSIAPTSQPHPTKATNKVQQHKKNRNRKNR